MFNRILYMSLVDLSLPNGPGVNERGFLKELLGRIGPNLHAVVPSPTREMPNELTGLDATFLPRGHSVRATSGWAQANLAGGVVGPRAVRRFRPDLIVMRAAGLPFPQWRIAREARVPFVLKTAGDLAFESFYAQGRLRRMAAPLNERMWSRLMNGALCVDVVSPTQASIAARLHPRARGRVHVVDNSVDIELFTHLNRAEARRRFGYRKGEFVVGYVGTRPMQRGGKEVVDVVAQVPGLRGLVVGDSGQADDLRTYAASRGVSDSVTIFGEADFSQVPGLMAAIDIGFSIRRQAERGQSELKVRQYLATGLCVVGTAVSNDFLEDFDFARVIESVETSSVVAATVSLLNTGEDGLVALRAQAREYAEAKLSLRAQMDHRMELWNRMSDAPGPAIALDGRGGNS